VAKRGGWLAKYAAVWARNGDPYPLIARLVICNQRSSEPLTDDEFLFIRDVLEAKAGKKTSARLRQLEKQLIAAQYDGLIDDDGMKPKAAFEEVVAWRGRSPRTVRRAIQDYGRPRRQRRGA
jgi:hypothetical protein